MTPRPELVLPFIVVACAQNAQPSGQSAVVSGTGKRRALHHRRIVAADLLERNRPAFAVYADLALIC